MVDHLKGGASLALSVGDKESESTVENIKSTGPKRSQD
jgi:hypothetical protein